MEKDIIVIGGGAAGVAAVVSASKTGKKVLLIEQNGFLGGLLSGGMVSSILGGEVNGGFYRDFIIRMEKYGAIFKPTWGRGHNPEYMKIVLEEMCEDAGVDILYHSTLTGMERQANRIKCVTIANKEGIKKYSADMWIDCSGDADLACRAGAEYEKGDPLGKMMPASLRFMIGNIDFIKAVAFMKKYQAEHPQDDKRFCKLDGDELIFSTFESLIAMARGKGEIHSADWAYGGFAMPGRPNELVFNNPYISDVDGTSVRDLTRAQLEGKKYVLEMINFFRKYIDGFQNSYLVSIAPLVGIRETRRIIGDYVVTGEDVLYGRKFEDAVARNDFMFDLHSHDGKKSDETTLGVNQVFPETYCDIPLRALIPKGMDNLLVAGRCISTTRDANSALRVGGICFATGQAAGVAAAIALQETCSPRNISNALLYNKLRDQGVNI